MNTIISWTMTKFINSGPKYHLIYLQLLLKANDLSSMFNTEMCLLLFTTNYHNSYINFTWLNLPGSLVKQSRPNKLHSSIKLKHTSNGYMVIIIIIIIIVVIPSKKSYSSHRSGEGWNGSKPLPPSNWIERQNHQQDSNDPSLYMHQSNGI